MVTKILLHLIYTFFYLALIENPFHLIKSLLFVITFLTSPSSLIKILLNLLKKYYINKKKISKFKIKILKLELKIRILKLKLEIRLKN